MAMYESDLTKFMREFLAKNPGVAEKQTVYRATWWDKQLDRDERARWKQSAEAQPPYPYYNNP